MMKGIHQFHTSFALSMLESTDLRSTMVQITVNREAIPRCDMEVCRGIYHE